MATPSYHLDMEQGASFVNTFQWLAGGKFIAPIDDIQLGYPTLITVTGHGLNSRTPHPVIISGVEGCPDLNSQDTGISLATRIDEDVFSMPVSTVADEWEGGTGEITYFLPTDLTGYTGEMKIRKNWHSTEVIHTISTAAGTMILTPEDGSIEISIAAIDTALFTFVNAVFDIDLTVGAHVARPIKGTIRLHKEITK